MKQGPSTDLKTQDPPQALRRPWRHFTVIGTWCMKSFGELSQTTYMTYTWLIMVWVIFCHICWYWEIFVVYIYTMLSILYLPLYIYICLVLRNIMRRKTGIKPYILWNALTYIYIHILVGDFNLSEKYESQLGWLFPYIMVNKKCSKPPTSHYIHIFAI